MSIPKLTVGIPVYNGGRVLKRALDSLMDQTFTDFEVRVIDNASTDDTEQIARAFAEKDPRILYHRNPVNMGASYSGRRMMFSSDAEFYVIMHCDLAWAPTFAEECLARLEADQSAVLAYSYCQFIDIDGNNLDLVRDTASFADDDPARRYLDILQKMGWCTAFHGIMRRPVMLDLVLAKNFNNNAAGDNEFLALMALKGKLIQIEKPLLYRLKDTYQRSGESMDEHYLRLYKGRGLDLYLPFINFIRDHCYDVAMSDLPAETVDHLTKQTVATLLARYDHFIAYEIKRLIDLILNGEFKRGWGRDEDQVPSALAPSGQYRYLDLTYLLTLNQVLDTVYAFRPKFPHLHLVRAMVLLALGRRQEGLTALEMELQRDPLDRKTLELKAKLTGGQNSRTG